MYCIIDIKTGEKKMVGYTDLTSLQISVFADELNKQLEADNGVNYYKGITGNPEIHRINKSYRKKFKKKIEIDDDDYYKGITGNPNIHRINNI